MAQTPAQTLDLSSWSPLARALAGALAAVVCALGLLSLQAALWPPAVVRIAPDNQSDLNTVVLHFDPQAAATIDKTYRDILAAVPDGRFRVVVASAADFEAFMERFKPADARRFEPVVMDRPITTWSRDRYTLTTAGQNQVLLVPPQKPALHGPRANDWLVPFRLALGDASVSVRELDFDFDGGDMIAGPARVFADVNLMRKNPTRMPNAGAVASTLEEIVGRPVFVLGKKPEDVPHHHIGMYLTPLPDGAVAVGSPALAVELLGGTDGAEFVALQERLKSQGLPAIDLSEATLHRFETPARELRAAGYDVVALPLLPLADQVTFITYNNGQFHALAADTEAPAPASALKHTVKHEFLMPSYGIETLDQAAREIFARRGVRARPIDVADVFRFHGSVRCLINVL